MIETKKDVSDDEIITIIKDKPAKILFGNPKKIE